MLLDRSVLPVYSHARKISDVLVRARQAVEKRRLAAVLVSYKSKCKQRPIRQRIPAPFRVELAALTESRMLSFLFLSRYLFFH